MEPRNEANYGSWEHQASRNDPHKKYVSKEAIRGRIDEIKREISTIKNQNPLNRTELIGVLEREWNKLDTKMKRGESHSIIAKGKMQSHR